MYGEWHSLGGAYRGLPGIRTLDYSAEGMRVELDVPGFEVLPVNGYTRVRLPGYEWDLDLVPGSPELPLVPVPLGIPAGMGAEIRSVEITWSPVMECVVHPVQPLTYDCPGEDPGFIGLDPDLRGTHPRDPAVIREMGSLFEVNVALLRLSPLRWNPETGLLEAASRIGVELGFTGVPAPQTPLRPETARMVGSLISNYDLMGIPVNSNPMTSDDVVYIVLTVEENLPEVTPLLSMVNLLGHRVQVEVLPTNSTPGVIRSTILSHYTPGVTRFVLIVGTHQQLPSFNFGNFVGDFYYQTLSGDNLPDIAVGRFPGGAGLIENMVNKSMAYSTFTGTPGEPSIPATTMLCAHEEDYPYKYTMNKNAIMNWNYVIMNPVFDTFYPPEGATQEQVKERINAGVGTVNYRGHGSVTTWQWSLGWNAGAIYSLENTFFPPVFNIACDNGKHDVTYQCLCKSWLYAVNKGASGTCGASAPSATIANNRFDRVIYWQLYDVGNTCAAEMHAAAQTDIILTQGSPGLNNARMYHWFGDPSMDIFNCDEIGSPFPIELDCPDYAYHGPNSITVTLTSRGLPVEGAVVTATDGIGNHPDHPETFYFQTVTNSSGQAVLEFSVQGGATVGVGARLHNLTPAFAEIQVWPEGIEGEAPPVFALHPVVPSPAASRVTLDMEIGTPGAYELTVIDLAGRTVDRIHSGFMGTGRHSRIYSPHALPPGLYFVHLRGEGVSASTRMLVIHR